jgi:hypothetical protein
LGYARHLFNANPKPSGPCSLRGPFFRVGRGISSRARRRDRVWPPLHRRDVQRRSLPRIDPATRCAPTWPLERIRCATAVCYLQRDIFIKRSGLDCIPTIVHSRWSHCAVPNSDPSMKRRRAVITAAGHVGARDSRSAARARKDTGFGSAVRWKNCGQHPRQSHRCATVRTLRSFGYDRRRHGDFPSLTALTLHLS